MKKYYFTVVSAVTLALSLIGFSDNLVTDIGQPSNTDPKFVVHGLFCLAWMIVFVAQANLARTGRYQLHEQLGTVGLIVAMGVTASTVYVFVAVWEGWNAMPAMAKANRFLLPSYSALIFAAWVNRHRPEYHKRMVCMGTLYLLLPIIDRAANHLQLNPVVFDIVVWNGMFVSLFAYDWVVARKIHPVTYLGFGWFYIVWTLAELT